MDTVVKRLARTFIVAASVAGTTWAQRAPVDQPTGPAVALAHERVVDGGITTGTMPTWGHHQSKAVAVHVDDALVRFVVSLDAGDGPYTCSIHRSVGDGPWAPMLTTPLSCAQSPNIAWLDGELHAVYHDATNVIRHLVFSDPVHRDDHVVVPTDAIVEGPDEQTNNYSGLAASASGLTLVFNARGWELHVADFNGDAWHPSVAIERSETHACLYPCVVVGSDGLHILVGRYRLGSTNPPVYDGVTKYTRRSGRWTRTTCVDASGAHGVAATAGDLFLGSDRDDVIGLVTVDHAAVRGIEVSGTYLVRGEDDWRLTAGDPPALAPHAELVSSTFVGGSNKNGYVDSDGRTWVAATVGGPAVALAMRERGSSTWSEPIVVAQSAAAPVTIKRKSGSDWLDHVAVVYSADLAPPHGFRSIGWSTGRQAGEMAITPGDLR